MVETKNTALPGKDELRLTITARDAIGEAEMNEAEAVALAKLVKRIGWPDLLQHSLNNDEAYLMKSAISKTLIALAGAGFSAL